MERPTNNEIELMDKILNRLNEEGSIYSDSRTNNHNHKLGITSEEYQFLCKKIEKYNPDCFKKGTEYNSGIFLLLKEINTERFISEDGFKNYFEILDKEINDRETKESLEFNILWHKNLRLKYWWVFIILGGLLEYIRTILFDPLK